MRKNNYVLSHNYGYGHKNKVCYLNKLRLRNEHDLQVYLNDIIDNAFCCKFENDKLMFDNNTFLIKILTQ